MKIYIPFDNYNKIGGPSSFMNNLKEYLDNNNITYLDSPENANAVFFPVNFPLKKLKNLKKKDCKIIQRLDGVYYPSQHGIHYLYRNYKIKNIYKYYSDHVIFQSEYSKKQCFKMLGNKRIKNYTIIRNGVDIKEFYPSNNAYFLEKDTEYQFINIGCYRKNIMLLPIIKALDSIKKTHKFKLTLVGPILKAELKKIINRDYINWVGPKNKTSIASLLRKSHLFIHSQLNDNCPNAVIEAVASGLPIVGFNSGSMSELLFFNQELLASTSDKIIQHVKDFKWKKLVEKIILCISYYNKFRKESLKYKNLYTFDQCGEKYVKVFKKILRTNN